MKENRILCLSKREPHTLLYKEYVKWSFKFLSLSSLIFKDGKCSIQE